MAGGARPGAGRPFGARNKKTIEREIVEQAALERKVAARAIVPMQGKLTLEKLLGIALERMDAAMAGGEESHDRFVAWFDRTLSVASQLTKYQTPQLRAIAVAHAEIRPPVLDLTRLTDKQLATLRQIIQIAGPSNIAGTPTDERETRPLGLIHRRPDRSGNGGSTY
jgi:hypothetical protein